MLPTFGNGVNFVNAFAYVGSSPERGDIVSIRMAGISIMYVKRIVGMPGESVAFEGGRLVINGDVMAEPYLQYPSDWNRDPVVLGPSEYFVVGDNRSMPIANHVFGRVERKRIVGRVILCKNLFVSWVP
jgi:signal peptidase I